MTVVTVEEATANLPDLLEAVERGEPVIIKRDHGVDLRIVVDTAPKPGARQPGRLKGLIAFDDRFFEPLPEEDLRLWEGRGKEE